METRQMSNSQQESEKFLHQLDEPNISESRNQITNTLDDLTRSPLVQAQPREAHLPPQSANPGNRNEGRMVRSGKRGRQSAGAREG